MGAIFLLSLCAKAGYNDILPGKGQRQDIREALILLCFSQRHLKSLSCHDNGGGDLCFCFVFERF